MSRQQNTEPRHEAREAWRQSRRPGDTTAVFRPGETLRCPGTLRIPGYHGPCGFAFNWEVANDHTRVIIRVSTALHAGEPQTGTTLRCPKCGTGLEKLVLREAE